MYEICSIVEGLQKTAICRIRQKERVIFWSFFLFCRKRKEVFFQLPNQVGDQDHYHEIDTDGGNFPFHFGGGVSSASLYSIPTTWTVKSINIQVPNLRA